jgi:UDP-glucose 4-epimerase
MKALITGGAGFIGSHLAEALCRRGVRTVVLDDLSSGTRRNLPSDTPHLEFIEGSVTDPEAVRRAVAGCERVFHLSALVSVPQSVAQPLESHRRNVLGTLEVLTAARAAGVRRVVVASSSAVYGDGPEPRKREDLPPRPQSPYALQKYAAEQYARLFHALYGLETVALRFFNVFGPRQAADSPYSGVIARFCEAFLSGTPPRIFGDGRQSRDFVYVTDVVAALLAAAEVPAARAAGRVFNVGTGQSRTLLELVAALQKLTGRMLQPQFEPPRPGDIRHSCPDLTATHAALGWQAAVTWEEGLARTLDFYRTRQD